MEGQKRKEKKRKERKGRKRNKETIGSQRRTRQDSTQQTHFNMTRPTDRHECEIDTDTDHGQSRKRDRERERRKWTNQEQRSPSQPLSPAVALLSGATPVRGHEDRTE